MTDYVRGLSHLVSASVTRPDDTNAYTAGDVICNSTSAPVILTFPRAVVGSGESGIIAHAQLIDSASQATKLDAELWLFDTTVAMDNDNAAFTPTDAELATCLGVIEFDGTTAFVGDATVGADGNCIIQASNLAIPIRAVAAQNAIFGILVARNGYTPVASESFTIRLHVAD